MLLRDALWIQNGPAVLLREEDLIPSLLNGILCKCHQCHPPLASALRDSPAGAVGQELAVCKERPEAVGKVGPGRS